MKEYNQYDFKTMEEKNHGGERERLGLWGTWKLDENRGFNLWTSSLQIAMLVERDLPSAKEHLVSAQCLK